jgi:hypothetical protein
VNTAGQEGTKIMSCSQNTASLPAAPQRGFWHTVGRSLTSRSGILIAAATGIGVGIAIGGSAGIGQNLAPLLYVLPCAVMMLLCMKGRGSGAKDNAVQQAAPDGPADPAKS